MKIVKKYKYPIILTILCFSVLISFQHCGKGGIAGSGNVGMLNDPLSASGACSNSIVAGRWISTTDSTTGLTFTGDCRYINDFCKSTGTYPANIIGDAGTVLITVDSKAADAPVQCLPVGADTCQYRINKTVTPNELDVVCGNVWGTYKKVASVASTAPSTTTLFYPANSTFSANPAIITHVQNIKAGVTCLPGRSRLQNDVTFFVSGNYQSGSTISGNFQAGILPGDNSELHVGVSAFRDLMFVTKVTNGSQVLGFNVTLSYCDVANPYPNFPLMVSNDRQLTNFMAPQGIVLDMNTYCGYGVIDAALNTVITSQPSASNQLTAPFTFPTAFTKPVCNGQF